jgi:hypothetical protein
VDDVMDVLNQQAEEESAALQAEEEERQREEQLRKRVGVLAYEGYLEKKSPASTLADIWQVRLCWVLLVGFYFFTFLL